MQPTNSRWFRFIIQYSYLTKLLQLSVQSFMLHDNRTGKWILIVVSIHEWAINTHKPRFSAFIYFAGISRTHLVKKRPGVDHEDIILQKDNIPVHTAHAIRDVLGFQRLSHPPYSPNTAQMNFIVFLAVNPELHSIRFDNVTDLCMTTVSSFDVILYQDLTWVSRRRKCVRVRGTSWRRCHEKALTISRFDAGDRIRVAAMRGQSVIQPDSSSEEEQLIFRLKMDTVVLPG